VSGATTATNPINGNPVEAKFPKTRQKVIDIEVIPGVTPPVNGTQPVQSISTEQYTGTVSWYNHARFEANTVYEAHITLTPTEDYSLNGVVANFFSVEDEDAKTTVSNSANSGVLTVTFPATDAIVDLMAIPGITPPAVGATPVTAITTTQYTGTVTWMPADVPFKPSTQYTATITLTPAKGYTLTDVETNFFTVSGAIKVENSVNSGVITAEFPETSTTVVNAQTPSITTQPQPDTIYTGDTPASLTVTATVVDGGTLSFQWYRHTEDSNSGGTAIAGATESSYIPPVTEEGTVYYYVMITNTNPSANGLTVTTAASRAVAVTVQAPVVSCRVMLEVSPYFESNPSSGSFTVQSGSDLEITLTPQSSLPSGSVPQATFSGTSSGVIVTPHANGTWTVRIAQVQEFIMVMITASGTTPADTSRRVTLEVSPHFQSDPSSGSFTVQSVSDLEITLTPQPTLPEGYIPQVTFSGMSNGVTVTPNANGTWTVHIERIQESIMIMISAAGTPIVSPNNRVTLEVSPHFLSDPSSGSFTVESGHTLLITLAPLSTLPKGSVPQVTVGGLNGGITVTPNANGTWTVRISRIQESVVVTISASSSVAIAEASSPAMQVWSHRGRLYITATQSGEVHIYHLSGARVKVIPVSAGETVTEPLPSGVYVVTQEGRSRKIHIF
jgi:hypothetical protein